MNRSGVLVSLAIVASAALVAAPAAAKKPKKVVTATQTASSVGVPQFSEVRATASCPKKRKLVGGGFAADADQEGGLFPMESHSSGKRGWVATGLVSGEGDPSFSAYAYCRKGAPKLKQESSTVVLPGTSEEVGPDTSAQASCPKRRKAVAGGFEVPPATNAAGERRPGVVTSSSRDGKREWGVSAQLVDAASSTQLTAYVYCSRKKRRETTAADEVDANEVREVPAPPCSKGTALAGGFQAPPLGGTSFVVPFASLRVGEQWVTRTIQGANAGTVSTYAYCG